MPHTSSSNDIPDALLAGYLVLSPAWASWLTEVNEMLTTLSLVIGIGLAAVRLWLVFRKRV